MKFLGNLRFELAYQVRRAWPWMIGIALVALTFQFMRVNYLEDAVYAELFLNSTFIIAAATVFGGLMWVLIAGVVAGEAAARDVTTGMHPLVYTTPVSKIEYLGGRFAAAFLINAVLLAAVQAGILLAIYAPGVAVDRIGPFRPAAYLTPYVYIALVNAFTATSIQFALATRTGRPMAAYVGSFLLFFTGFFIAAALLFWQWWGALLDPIGFRLVVEYTAREWTTAEKNTRLLTLDGMLLRNRLVWIGAGVTALVLNYVRFRFAHRVQVGLLTRLRTAHQARQTHPTPPVAASPAPISATVGHAASPARFPFHTRQILAITWTSFHAIVTSWSGAAMLALITLMTIPVVVDQMEWGGAPLIPATALVLRELTGPLATQLSRWLTVPLLTVYLAGELVWRERDAGIGEITDAMPGSEWAPLMGKFLGLALVLALLMLLISLAGIAAQTLLDYRRYEIGLYLKVMLGLQWPEYLLFAALSLFVHVVANQKYAGHLTAILIYVFMAVPAMFGVEHDLLIFGAGPGWSYSEMRGFGTSLAPWAWFKVYWGAWALMLMAAARLMWVRGCETRLRPRLRIARQRLTGPTLLVSAASLALLATVGGFVFYNTNLLNAYVSRTDIAERRAEYERRYARYADLAQPTLTATSLLVEIHPDPRDLAAAIHGRYTLVNHGGAPIDEIHLTTAPGIETAAISLDRAAMNVLTDEMHSYRIFRLERPLQPGDSLNLNFDVRAGRNGVREDGVSDAVVPNGTRLPSTWLPAIGYQRSHELRGPRERRDHGLPPRSVVPALEDADASAGRSAGMAFEAVVGTRADQTAVAPGALLDSWIRNGRRYFRYATNAPIGNEYAIFSAAYTTREAQWSTREQSVAIRVFHHPTHTANVERFLRAAHASLDFYMREFGPYPYNHLTFVEAPSIGTGMHADPGVITFTEGAARWRPNDDDEAFDLPFAVVAHEMAHQWTVPYAIAEGAPVLSESLAWYYAMKAVERSRGPGQLEHLLRFMRQPHPYPPIRRGEPLLRGLDPYMAYRRGPLALYALSEYLGDDRVNAALRQLLEKYRRPNAPQATTRDLYRELQAVTPNGYQYLLRDLFEVNTFWELETKQVTAQPKMNGTWQVTLDIGARKTVYDEAGVETQTPVNDWIEIGIYSAGDTDWQPMYLENHRITSAAASITVTVPRAPVRAGVDPRHLLIDTQADNNVRELPVAANRTGDPSSGARPR